MKRIGVLVVLLMVVLYVGDYLSVRFRIPHNRQSFGSVKVQRYYVVPQKSGRPDLYFDKPESQACVQSLFPHFGDPPCWYLRRKSVQRVNE